MKLWGCPGVSFPPPAPTPVQRADGGLCSPAAALRPPGDQDAAHVAQGRGVRGTGAAWGRC